MKGRGLLGKWGYVDAVRMAVHLTYIDIAVCMSVLFIFIFIENRPLFHNPFTRSPLPVFFFFSHPAESTMLPTPLSLAGSAAPPVCSIFHQVIRNTPWQVPLWSVMAAEFLSLCAFVARMA